MVPQTLFERRGWGWGWRWGWGGGGYHVPDLKLDLNLELVTCTSFCRRSKAGEVVLERLVCNRLS